MKFNAVAEWWADYIAYGTLKRQIYRLEKKQHGSTVSMYHDLEANEDASLLGHTGNSTDGFFKPLLDRELLKITAFYETQEKELMDEVDTLDDEVLGKESQGLHPQGAYMDDDDDDDDDDGDDRSGIDPTSVSGTSSRRLRAESFSKSPRPGT